MSQTGALEAVLALVVVAVVLTAAVWSLRRAGTVVRLRRRHRARFGRLIPLIEVLLVVAAILVVATIVLDARPAALTAFVAGLLALLLAAGWFAVRDVVTGAVLRAEDSYAPGQWLRAGDVEGRIRTVGLRSLEVERENGTRIRVPYARLADTPLIRAGGVEDPTGHTFSVELPPQLPPARMLPVLRAAARDCFFASATREPQVGVASGPAGHRFDVTVFTLDRTFLPEIETAVRARAEREQERLGL